KNTIFPTLTESWTPLTICSGMTPQSITPQVSLQEAKHDHQVFNLPDLGEGLTEADLVTRLVEEGQTIAVDQPIAEVETAKALVEVPSPYEGTVLTLHGKPGETLHVGNPLITVGGPSDTPQSADQTSQPADQPGALSYREE